MPTIYLQQTLFACIIKHDTTHEMEQICHPSHFPLLQGIYKQYYKSAFFRVKRHESIYKGHAMSPHVCFWYNTHLTTRRPSQQGGFHQHSTGIEKTCHYTTPLVFRTKVGCVYNFCVKCFKHLFQRMIETGISTR